ncbi:AAA family ATPase [Candidatus Avelusimicrobium faecicola]|uniref:AAA family ATPase n=1 Tax=Candidatus Avelusimicrobium faecicola TaxID=3416205 RepID=UPI003D13AEA8
MTNTFKLVINNIGPLSNLSFTKDIKALNLAIFANNGSGKTFISRVFSCLQDAQQNKQPVATSPLLSFGEKKAKFEFSFSSKPTSNSPEIKNIFTLTENINEGPHCSQDSKWIIHTFNRDFINRNLTLNTFTLKNAIPGEIIIGETNAKIAELENKKISLVSQLNELEEKIRNDINQEKKNISTAVKYISTLKEYSNITYERIFEEQQATQKVQDIKISLEKLQNLPKDLPSLSQLYFQPNIKPLYEINQLLTREVSLVNVAEKYKKKIQEHYSFIEQGVSLLDTPPAVCPFCEQSLNETAKHIIDGYITYFTDEEGKCAKDISQAKNYLKSLITQIQTYRTELLDIISKYNIQKEYFPSIKEQTFSLDIDFETIEKDIKVIDTLLDQKMLSKERIDFDCNRQIDAIADIVEKIQKELPLQNQLVADLEGKKISTNGEEKKLRQNLCTALLYELRNKNLPDINKIVNYREEINKLEQEIKKKQENSKIAKQDAIDNEFSKLLKEFFKDRYTYDPKKHFLKLNDTYPLQESALDKISEGEKSILAFCYFLALIHSLVNNKEDYRRLLLIIDDPISSLDFNFVYQVAQEIRDLKINFELMYSRFIILTHNIEFMSILIKNKIISTALFLDHSKLSELDSKYLLPYEHHLRHIFDISIQKSKPTFQTPNSIRHVLETLCNFKYPEMELYDFINQEHIFESCKSSYSLIHDLSHGRIRTCSPCTDDNLIDCCKSIVQYLQTICPGQITQLQN